MMLYKNIQEQLKEVMPEKLNKNTTAHNWSNYAEIFVLQHTQIKIIIPK